MASDELIQARVELAGEKTMAGTKSSMVDLISEKIFLSGESYFDALIKDIDRAKTSIDLETYIFQNGVLGGWIAEALIRAAHRGVIVRILVDGAGSSDWGHSLARQLRDTANIESRVFHPLPWRVWQWHHGLLNRAWVYNIFYLLARINKRNHRKVCVIDESIVYIGSANIDDCHLTLNSGGKNWRDTGVCLEGVDTIDLREAFEVAWNHLPLQERIQTLFERVQINSPIRLNYTRHRRRVFYKSLLRRISRCQHRVWITNAYFVPDNFLLVKLTDLAQKGVDVRILLPQKSDVVIMTWASAAFYDKLLKSGVRIFEYTPSMLHAKSLILDDWFIIGSSNLNHRSLLHDFEVDVTIRSTEAKTILEQQFLMDLSQATEIQWLNWQKSSWIKKMIGRLLLYVKYWI